MAVEYIFEGSVGSGSSYCHSKYIIRSNGWSGKVIKTSGDTQEDRTFLFHGKMTISGSQDGTLETLENAYVERNEINVSYIGISLEHFGEYWNTNWPDAHTNQIIGFEPIGQTTENSHEVPSYGAKSTDSNPTFQAMNIISEGYTNNIEQQIHGAERVTGIAIGTIGGYRGLMSCEMKPYNGGGWVYDLTVEIETDLPIFETDADLMVYCNSRGEDTSTIANKDTTPEEDYEAARRYNYIWNIYGHNANNATQYTGYRNYRFYGGNGKICLYRVRATAGSPYTVKLANYSSYTVKAAGVYDTDEEDYQTIENPELYFLHESIQFSSSNYYKVFKWSTDLLIFGSQSEAEMWARDEIDARQAENFNQVSRAYDIIVDPGYGNPDPGYDNGVNGQSYVHGARMWVLDSGQLNAFFDDIFDPLNIQSLLDGTKLFGSNEIGAIQGITYFPINIEDVARVNGTAQAIKIGSFTCPTATGRYVWNNNKLIDCGKVFIAPVYKDFRDYRMKLFIQLPYVGTHELNISKFLNHYLEVFYAVDITTGGCTAHVLADGISYGDSFDGFMASQRPLTALDQTAYLNSVMGCVSSIVNRESGMINEAKGAIAGVATGKAGQVAKGGSSFSGLNTSFGAISDLYGLSQAVKDAPMSTRGGFAGCLGFFGNQKIHIITVQSKSVKPLQEQQIVGYPSHVSQRVGNFSGFLKCSAINMTNFSGTAQELSDIQTSLSKGIYI